VELPADELKEPLATDSAMSWSKQHTTVRRCVDHNEHSLQHHNAHCTAEEEGTHKSFPHNKTTQKQKVDGTYSAELQATQNQLATRSVLGWAGACGLAGILSLFFSLVAGRWGTEGREGAAGGSGHGNARGASCS
jgi:hypothetical protein